MNHLTHPIYIKARDLILASEGMTLEDEKSFGSLGIDEDGKIWKYVGVGGLDWVREDEGYSASECKSVGRPISLDRVLMALGQRKYVCEVSKKYKSVDFYNYYDEDEDLPSFNLGKPLHLQPLETIEKIVEILEANQK